jgi:hypothetical protein
LEPNAHAAGPLLAEARQDAERMLGFDFSTVRIHADREGGRRARSAGAVALTEDEHVYIQPWAYQLWHPLSRGLIAHELTHVAQQRLGHALDHDSARNAFVSRQGHTAILGSLARDRVAGVPAAYWARLRTGERGLTPAPPGLQQRCVAGCKGCEEGQADALKEKKARLAELDAIIASPTSSFGQLAAAKAERLDVAHDIQLLETGAGTHVGNRAADQGQGRTPAPSKTDCTEYTVQVLRETFAAKGQAATFTKILAAANKSSGGKLKGTKLIQELQTQAGWKVVYWNPDTKFVDKKPGGADDTEHTYSAQVAGSKGTYYDIPIEKDKMVTDYSPKGTTGTRQDVTSLEKLKKVPFGILTARGGMHMAMLISGVVFEVHYTAECTSRNVFDATPLESWAWLSGVVAAPAADIDAAWR